MTRVIEWLRASLIGATITLALPAVVLVVVLGSIASAVFREEAPSYAGLMTPTRRYSAALAADSAARWRRAAVPAQRGAAGILAPRGDSLSQRVANEVAVAAATAQAAGALPTLRTPVLISARASYALTDGAVGSAPEQYPTVSSRFVVFAVAPGEPCVASVRVSPEGGSATNNAGSNQPRALDAAAPCLFVAAFGAPGPRIKAWLDSTEWGAVSAPVRAAPLPRSEPWKPTRSHTAPLQIFDGLDPNRSVSRYLARDLLRCVDGHVDACGHAALAGVSLGARRDGDTQFAGVLWRRFGRSSVPLPRVSADGTVIDDSTTIYFDTLLGDLAADLGAARFQRVWQSDLPLEAAYAKETGEPFGAWAQRWMRVRPSRAPMPFGASVQSLSLWWVVAAVLLSLQVVVRAYRRAEFG